MNWRVTAVLFIILLALGGFVWYQNQQEPVAADLPISTPPPPTPVRTSLIKDVTVETVTRLEVTRLEDGAHAVFQRDDAGNWSRTVPTTTQLISQTMNTRVIGLVNLRSSRTLSAAANPLSAYGLDTAGYQIILAAVRDETPVRFTLLVGDETVTGTSVYVQRKGDPRVHIVPQGTIQNITDLLEEPPLKDEG